MWGGADCKSCAEVANLSSEDLLQRIRSEIRVTELTTGFPAADSEFDLSRSCGSHKGKLI